LLADSTVQVRLSRTAGETTVKQGAARLLSRDTSSTATFASRDLLAANALQQIKTQTSAGKHNSSDQNRIYLTGNLETCREPKVCERFPIRYVFPAGVITFFTIRGQGSYNLLPSEGTKEAFSPSFSNCHHQTVYQQKD